MASGLGLVVGLGMAAFAPPFGQSSFVLGPIAGSGSFLMILYFE
jgi:hypothetical protein